MNGLASFAGRLLLVALLTCTLVACGKKPEEKPPTVDFGPSVSIAESPDLFVKWLNPRNQGLASWQDMRPVLQKSLRYVSNKPPEAVVVTQGGTVITWGQLGRTLTRLMDMLPQLDADPGLLQKNFQWVAIPGGISYSGYYEPTIRASRTRKPGYEQPIYRCPPEIKRVNKGRGSKRSPTRRSIEEGRILAGRGLELAWAADPVDSFFLEIQGSGRLLFDDGTQAFVNYDCQNGHKYKSSGRIMREKGLLRQGHIFEQREWLRNNPHRVREILNENPSYVFFRFGDKGPTGAMGYEVTPWLSLATSRSQIPLGSVVAYAVNAPDETRGKRPLRGIGFAQDVGGAIKGRRIDVFCGADEHANFVASHLDAKGPAWILLSNDVMPPITVSRRGP
jgi:membrane-bound lytic murein transglycosylase A